MSSLMYFYEWNDIGVELLSSFRSPLYNLLKEILLLNGDGVHEIIN